MHIDRNLQLVFPTVPAQAAAQRADTDTPRSSRNQASNAVHGPGRNTGVVPPDRLPNLADADPTPSTIVQLSGMSLQDQLETGKSLGVFTKITLHKEGVLVAKPPQSHSADPSAFVASAVTTLRDYEEGFALLKKNSPEVDSKTSALLSSSLRGLQSVAARLNVFA